MNAWLTPAVVQPCAGKVHSVFNRSANVMFTMPDGSERLITLVTQGLPKVPDGIRVPSDWIADLTVGTPAFLRDDKLVIDAKSLSLIKDCEWDGNITRHSGEPEVQTFLNMISELETGLDFIPYDRKKKAEESLCTENWGRFIGLGCGLTPSYDDACVGMLAIYRASGMEVPVCPVDLLRTTDVSARYLRLAMEGYFGQVVCDVIEALYGRRDMKTSVANIQKVGATSGKDMLRGMAVACKKLYG